MPLSSVNKRIFHAPLMVIPGPKEPTTSEWDCYTRLIVEELIGLAT